VTTLATGCSGASDPGAPAASQDPQLVASKLATLAVGVAVAGQGRGFFDNFLPCPRRGIIDYRNTPRGRQAVFTGCDAGDGVVVDGVAELGITPTPGDGRPVTEVDLEGPLRVGANAASSTVDRIRVSGIAFTTVDSPVIDALVPERVRIAAFGQTTTLDSRAYPATVFRPPLTIDAIPNAANSLEVLTGADLKRIAYHGALALASVLFDETLEIQRGEHVHTEPCGTLRVAPISGTNLPRMTANWNSCDVRHGLFESGAFTAEWSEFNGQTGRLAMVVQGSLTLGGGVPKVTVSRLEWSVSGVADLPGTIRITGRLVSGAQQRTFAFELTVDD
jgi:hypothetical protein